jgi:uncharacterized protein (DUF3820 family)
MATIQGEAFTKACAFVMPLGKYEGKTMARIGSSREGLLYLDWMVGQEWVRDGLKDALECYLGHPSISMQLDRYLD